jgi:hypothetical protein
MMGGMCTGTVIGAMRVVVAEAGDMVAGAMAVVAAMDGELRDQLSKPDPINL